MCTTYVFGLECLIVYHPSIFDLTKQSDLPPQICSYSIVRPKMGNLSFVNFLIEKEGGVRNCLRQNVYHVPFQDEQVSISIILFIKYAKYHFKQFSFHGITFCFYALSFCITSQYGVRDS
jgi:hypothetical protein